MKCHIVILWDVSIFLFRQIQSILLFSNDFRLFLFLNVEIFFVNNKYFFYPFLDQNERTSNFVYFCTEKYNQTDGEKRIIVIIYFMIFFIIMMKLVQTKRQLCEFFLKYVIYLTHLSILCFTWLIYTPTKLHQLTTTTKWGRHEEKG